MTPEQEKEKAAAQKRADDAYAREHEIMEKEANYFAMCLLMPEEWLRKDMVGLDITDDVAIARLAKKYKVPISVMAMRIGQLIPNG